MKDKPEIRNPKSENNSKREQLNDQNGFRFARLNFGYRKLFGISRLGCRIFVLVAGAVLLLPPLAQAQDVEKKFREANTSYRTGDFGKAAGLYQELAAEDPGSAVFLYNLGNANVKLGKMSGAILAYEKALRLAPRDRDIRQNLNYARGQVEYRVEDNRNWYLKAVNAVMSYFTQKEINLAALLSVMMFLAGGILHFLFRGANFCTGPRKFLLWLSVFLCAVAFAKAIETDIFSDAIVMAKESEVRYGPSQRDQTAFRVGEGIKVSIMDRREDWSRVVLTNGDGGWIRNSDIAEVSS